MRPDDLTLSSVNWEHGMLLTPEHFLRQERYFDSTFMWLLRYTSTVFGLVGGGPRLPESERGAVKHDPIVVIENDATGISISVTQCRALTPAGCIIDIDPAHPVDRRFTAAELEGVTEAEIHVVCEPHEKQPLRGVVDEYNPQMATERALAYSVALSVPADWEAYSAVVARARKVAAGPAFEKDSAFIPACTSMVSHSELAAAGRRILEAVYALSQRYNELHRAMQEFVVLFRDRGIETAIDIESMGFVGRMVVAHQQCLYDILYPVQPPQQFFAALRRFFQSAAVYLDLSPPVRQYFEILKETGESEFISILEQQRKAVTATPRWSVNSDLSVEVASTIAMLSSLQKLEGALEGKYLDFRTNSSLEAMNFLFDRGGRVLYKLAAKPSRFQGFAEELIVTFAQLRLEGREKYRIVLVGAPEAVFEKGTRINVEIRVNEGAGFKRRPLMCTTDVQMRGQRNFEFDFEAQDVPVINDIRLSMMAHYPFRSALLYVRQRFHIGGREEVARPIAREEVTPSAAPREPAPPSVPPGFSLPETPDATGKLPPWEAPSRGEKPQSPGTPPTPSRRRRLE